MGQREQEGPRGVGAGSSSRVPGVVVDTGHRTAPHGCGVPRPWDSRVVAWRGEERRGGGGGGDEEEEGRRKGSSGSFLGYI